MPGNTVLAFGLFAAFAIVAAVATMYMGPFGLVLLGLLTLLICNQYVLDESAPGWGLAVFRHRMTQTGSATERAAAWKHAARRWRRCACTGRRAFFWWWRARPG